MKTIVAIALSFLVFFQSVGIGLSDMFMMKDLVEHAKYHSEEFGDDLFTFFEKHYGELKAEHQKNHQEEKSQHEKLPFQHNNCNHLVAEVVIPTYELPHGKTLVSYTANPHFFYQNLYSYLERVSIFQPPKIA
ncbi:hypothetical protein EI546_04925 [Aequorivita sp. H23M31]|uniref:Uncharacterized protein n=1 Tax=Aequorivita ciconiae TaxID=2494375 RepID=A0A410G1I7_9FLAO|nr:hypothetical protein [Aequorivita sp. H23M31]QAA81111.1 hypothetical protein EI546_04925 [Aequorivita sp. H23M31]